MTLGRGSVFGMMFTAASVGRFAAACHAWVVPPGCLVARGSLPDSDVPQPLPDLPICLVGSVPVFAAADRVAGPSSDGQHRADDQDDDADRPDDRATFARKPMINRTIMARSQPMTAV